MVTHPLDRPRSNTGRCLMWALIGALAAILVVCGGGWAIVRATVGIRPNAGWIDADHKKVVPLDLTPPADNGFYTYEEAATARVETPETSKDMAAWARAVSEHDEDTVATLTPRVRDVVTWNAAALSKLHEAADKDYLSPAAPGEYTVPPWGAEHRSLARIATTAALMAHVDGDDQRALGLIDDAYALGINAPRGGSLVEWLAAVACVAIPSRASSFIMLDGKASAQALMAHATRARELRGRMYPLSKVLTWEWQTQKAMADRARQGGPQEGESVASGESVGAASSLRGAPPAVLGAVDASDEWVEDCYARMIDALDRPFGDTSFDELMTHTEASVDPRRAALAQNLVPVWAKARAKYQQSYAVLMADETITCLEAYRKEKGRYADGLDALVPEYMPELPVDPWTGKSMLYETTDDGYLLYACGPDRKDDGGVCTETDRTTPDQVFVPVPKPKTP